MIKSDFYDVESCVIALKEKLFELTNDYSSDTIEAAMEKVSREGF